MSYHKIIVVGRLGRDPEMRYTPQGKAVTNFSIASDREFTQGGEKVKETTWFRVTVWDKQAETCNQYLKKGKMVLVDGRLVVDPKSGGPKIFNRSDGTPGASFEIEAGTVRFLSAGESSSESESDEGNGEIPF